MATASDFVILGTARAESGKGVARKLRKAGQVPAVLNHKGKSTLLSIEPKLLSKAWLGGKQFTLDFNGAKKAVKITELCIDPVKRLPLHVDLTYVE